VNLVLRSWRQKLPDQLVDQQSSRSSTSATAVKNLKDRIKHEMLEIRDKRDGSTHEWIAAASITELITPTEVVKILQNENEASWIAVDIDNLKEFVLQKSPRLFALLVYMNQVHLLKLFYRNSFDDSMFPIRFLYSDQGNESDTSSQTRWTIESTKAQRKISYTNLGVDDTAMEAICRFWQWKFFVPVFRDEDCFYVFDPACQMPFLEELETGEKFSFVRHFVIHRSHLMFADMEEIVRNSFVR